MMAIVIALVLTFSLLVTIHVTGSVALARRKPYWNGVVAFVVPPFFPYYAVRRRETAWAVAWCAAALGYGVVLFFAATWR